MRRSYGGVFLPLCSDRAMRGGEESGWEVVKRAESVINGGDREAGVG